MPASIIIACLHEEDTIRVCLERVTRAVPDAEVLVVHGGTDRTLAIATEMARSNPHIVPVRNENDQGKGHAIQVGIAHATHDVMCQWDADLQFPPDDIPAVLAPIQAGTADLVIGSRFMPGADRSQYKFSFFRVIGNGIVNNWTSLMCGRRMTDVTTGCKTWTRAAITKINFQDKKFVYEVEIVVRAARLKLRIAQVPVHYHNRQGGVSGHGRGWREFKSIVTCGLKLLLTATRIRLTT